MSRTFLCVLFSLNSLALMFAAVVWHLWPLVFLSALCALVGVLCVTVEDL
jgi:hypothetical protein